MKICNGNTTSGNTMEGRIISILLNMILLFFEVVNQMIPMTLGIIHPGTLQQKCIRAISLVKMLEEMVRLVWWSTSFKRVSYKNHMSFWPSSRTMRRPFTAGSKAEIFLRIVFIMAMGQRRAGFACLCHDSNNNFIWLWGQCAVPGSRFFE